jgi:hypothetical protein
VSRPVAALAAGAATFALVLAVSVLAWGDASSFRAHPGGAVFGQGARTVVVLLATGFVLYVCGLALLRHASASTGAVLALAAAIQLAPLAGPLLASTDAWTYWDYGRLAAVHDANPYVDHPAAFPGDPALLAMGSRWREETSVYGPAFTLVSEPLARAAGDSRSAAAWEYKTLAALAALVAAVLASRLARRAALAAAFVGWNPVLAVHFAGGGHNDAWVGALTLAALTLAAARRWNASGVSWVLAIAVKWVPIVFLGLHLLESRARRRPIGVAGLVSCAALVAAVASWRYGWRWLAAVAPLARHAHLETRYALPHRLQGLGVSREVALGLAAAALVVGLVWLARGAAHGHARLALSACLLLATTPYLAVWYLGWAVPLAAADDDDKLARVGVLAFSAYLLPQTIPL